MGLMIEARDGLVRVLVIIYDTVPFSNYNTVSKPIRQNIKRNPVRSLHQFHSV